VSVVGTPVGGGRDGKVFRHPPGGPDMAHETTVLVWSEGTTGGEVYPNDVNAAVAEHLNEHDRFLARTVSIGDDGQGVPEAALADADALVWWGHLRHDEVTDATVDRIERHVRDGGLGFLALHSAHYARPFTRLIDASGDLGNVRYDPPGERETIEVVAPDHPIAAGVEAFAVEHVEMFGEPFDVPEPETVVLRSEFAGGGWFRSCITFDAGAGRVAYVRPGHEELRIYHQPEVRRVIANATGWIAGD